MNAIRFWMKQVNFTQKNIAYIYFHTRKMIRKGWIICEAVDTPNKQDT